MNSDAEMKFTFKIFDLSVSSFIIPRCVDLFL